MIHVACAAEGAYVPHSAAMLRSVLVHGGGAHVHYLHSPRMAAADRERLTVMVDGLGGRIDFHEIADEQVEGLPDDPAFTPAMWHRILLPELVPDADRVLYLDVDTLAVDDLGPLWATELGDASIAAVTNVLQTDHRHHPATLGLDAADYFNSGVLLMNLARMRRDGASAALRQVALDRGAELGWPDQDALNLVLGPGRVPLHPRWNCMNSLYAFESSAEVFGREARGEALARPGIRHFEGPGANKPWHADCRFPLRERYFEHRAATPWPEVELVREPRRDLRAWLKSLRP